MTFVSASKVGIELCKVLGIPSKRVSAIRIICEAGGVAKVNIERFLDSEEMEPIKRIITNYSLTEIDDEKLADKNHHSIEFHL